MKKILISLMTGIMLMSFNSCGNDAPKGGGDEKQPDDPIGETLTISGVLTKEKISLEESDANIVPEDVIFKNIAVPHFRYEYNDDGDGCFYFDHWGEISNVVDNKFTLTLGKPADNELMPVENWSDEYAEESFSNLNAKYYKPDSFGINVDPEKDKDGRSSFSSMCVKDEIKKLSVILFMYVTTDLTYTYKSKEGADKRTFTVNLKKGWNLLMYTGVGDGIFGDIRRVASIPEGYKFYVRGEER